MALSLPIWQAIRTQYVVEGKSPGEIADGMEIARRRVYSLVCREGWTKERRAKFAQTAQATDARAREHVERVVAAQGTIAEQASILGLRRAVEMAQRPPDKESANAFRAFAGGSRDLVQVARQARGLDSQMQLGNGANVSLFFLPAGARSSVLDTAQAPARELKQAEQVTDIQASAVVSANPV